MSVEISKEIRASFAVAIALLLFGQFLNKPVHVDDANFLRLAEGVARDYRRPHLISINWTGTTVAAFEVLSNPPGIGWWLLPVLDAPIWVQHLWMLVWLLPIAWGARQLGKTFCEDDGEACIWVLLTCPVVVLSAHSFLPDLPLLACTTAGLGGFVSHRGKQEFWALVVGLSFLFRYSGCLIVAVLSLMAWRRSRLGGVVKCWPAFLPVIGLAINDFLVYGRWHLLAMFAFQNDGQHKTIDLACHNCVAAIAMLGGAGLLPILVWQRGSAVAAAVGAGIGAGAAFLSGQSLIQAVPTVIFTASGAAVVFLTIGDRSRELTLSTWALLGIVLFGISRFAATRYWIPFLPAFVLLGLRCRSDAKSIGVAVAVNLIVSLGLSIDDYEFAECERQAAVWVASISETGKFTGHWGWQYYLEKHGWTPLEPNEHPTSWLASSAAADSQENTSAPCLEELSIFPLPDRWPGPRTHSLGARAAYHAGGKGVYAPWTFTNEPYDRITLFYSCDQYDNGHHP
jgi:hypothetical protein